MGLKVRANRWYYRFRLNGKQYEGTTGLRGTKQLRPAALKVEQARRLALLTGPPVVENPAIGLETSATEFLDWCRHVRYRNKINSALRVSGSFRSILDFFAGKKLQEITKHEIERYKAFRASQDRAECTIRNDLNALSLFFGYAIRAGWLTVNPLKGENRVTRPSGDDAVRMHVISPAEEEAYFAACGKRHNVRDLAKLMILQGCRPDELLALEKSDYDPIRGTIKIRHSKTKAGRRELSLCGESVEILNRRLRSPGRWLFPSRHKPGDRIHQMVHTHTSVISDAALPWFVLYDFRHTWATRMVQDANCDLPTLAALLGHAGLRMVMKYVHPTAEHQKEAMKKYEASRPKKDLKIAK